MTNNKSFIFLSVAVALIWSSSSQAANQIGHLDKATADEVTGWACDKDTPTLPVKVKLMFGNPALAMMGGTITRTVTADRSSEAAVGALCGANVPHRFRYVPSAEVRAVLDALPENQRFIFAYATDSLSPDLESLWGSPAPFILYPTACPAGFSQSGSVIASSFRDYSTTKISTSTVWGPQKAEYFWLNGDGMPVNTLSVTGQSSFGLHVAVQHSGNPILVDSANSVDAIGVMKFKLPPPGCDVRVHWSSQINLSLGNGMTNDGGRISAAAIWRQQSTTTAFPSSLTHETKDAIWSRNPYTGKSASSTIPLSGSFMVPANSASSVLTGVWVLAMAKDGVTCIGDCDKRPENYMWISTSPVANQGLTLSYSYEPL